jgi:hypothetical protein
MKKSDSVRLLATTNVDRAGRNLISDEYGPVTAGNRGFSDIELTMFPASRISGRVVDLDGRPVANVLVNLNGRQNGEDPHQIWDPERSAPDGSFTIASVPPREYELILLPEGEHTYIKASPPTDTVSVVKGQDIRGLKVLLDLKLSITGRVTDGSGRPVEGVEVDCRAGRISRKGRTDRDGKYSVAGLEDGLYRVNVNQIDNKRIDTRDYPDLVVEDVPAGSENIDFVLHMGQSASIEGRVFNVVTGEPVTECELLVMDGPDHDRPWVGKAFESRRDADGGFRVEDLLTGPATLVVRAKGFAEAVVPVQELKADQPYETDVSMEPGVRLTGTVLDESGQSIPDAFIFAGAIPRAQYHEEAALATSDADGRFETVGLPAGKNQLSALHSKYPSTSVSVNLDPAADNEIDIVLSVGPTIEGTVYYDGQPLPDGELVLRSTTGTGEPRETKTDAQGAYRYEGVEPGGVMLAYRGSILPNEPAGNKRIVVRSAEAIAGVTTTVDFYFGAATSSIEGLVTKDGAPETNARMQLSIDTGESVESFMTSVSEGGAYLFESVPSGAASLQVHGPANQVRTVSMHIGGEEAVRRDIELSGGAVLAGEVTGVAHGETALLQLFEGELPVLDGTVAEMGLALTAYALQSRGSAMLDGDGPYHFDGLGSGLYTVIGMCLPQGYEANSEKLPRQIVTTTVEIFEGQENELDIDLR